MTFEQQPFAPTQAFQPPSFMPGGVLGDLASQMSQRRQFNHQGLQHFRQSLPFRLMGMGGMQPPFGMPFMGMPYGMDPFGMMGMQAPQAPAGPSIREQRRMEREQDDANDEPTLADVLLGKADDYREGGGEVEEGSGGRSGGLTKTDLDNAYKQGLIGADEYAQGLIDYGMSPEDASLRSEIYGPEGAASRSSGPSTGLNMTDLRKGFKLGRVTYEDYVSTLVENKGKTFAEAQEMARSDMGVERAVTEKDAQSLLPSRRNEWRKLYNARKGKTPPLKKGTVTDVQRQYARARTMAQKFREETAGKGTMDGYLAYVYGEAAKDAGPDAGTQVLNESGKVLATAFTDAFKGKRGYKAKEEGPRPRRGFVAQGESRQARTKAVESGKRSFKDDEVQAEFLAYKKGGGPDGPETWWKNKGRKSRDARRARR